jgi:hypothetical protein
MNEGKIAEMGTHDDLFRKKGTYTTLVSAQSLNSAASTSPTVSAPPATTMKRSSSRSSIRSNGSNRSLSRAAFPKTGKSSSGSEWSSSERDMDEFVWSKSDQFKTPIDVTLTSHSLTFDERTGRPGYPSYRGQTDARRKTRSRAAAPPVSSLFSYAFRTMKGDVLFLYGGIFAALINGSLFPIFAVVSPFFSTWWYTNVILMLIFRYFPNS